MSLPAALDLAAALAVQYGISTVSGARPLDELIATIEGLVQNSSEERAPEIRANKERLHATLRFLGQEQQ